MPPETTVKALFYLLQECKPREDGKDKPGGIFECIKKCCRRCSILESFVLANCPQVWYVIGGPMNLASQQSLL